MYFDELGMGDTQFSSSGEYFVDDKVDSDIAHFGLSNPIPACPSENIMGEGGQEHKRLLCLQVFLASAWRSKPDVSALIVFSMRATIDMANPILGTSNCSR